MEFYMELIKQELNKDIIDSHLIFPSSLTTFQILEPDEEVNLQPDILYLCSINMISERQLERLKKSRRNFLLFSVDGSVPDSFHASNYLVCSADFSLIFHFANKITDIFCRYQKWLSSFEKLITDAAPYQALVDTALEMLPYPMAMMNSDHHVLAYSQVPENDDALFYCMKMGYGRPFLNIIARSNPTLEEIAEAGCIDTISKISQKRIRVCKVRTWDPSSPYFIGMHAPDANPFPESAVKLFDLVVKYLERLVHAHHQNRKNQELPATHILRYLVTTPATDNFACAELLNGSQLSAKGDFHLLGIEFSNALKFRTDYHTSLLNDIQPLIGQGACIAVNSRIAILLFGDCDLNAVLESLKFILVTNDATCACSSLYHDLYATGKIWSQLLFMLKNHDYSMQKNILHYEDYYVRHIISYLKKTFAPETLIHSAFYQLKTFDEKNQTDYLHTLIVYLQNDCNTNTTADILGVHRNSLLYRIRKTEEILGFVIEDSDERLDMLFSSYFVS